LVGGGLATLLYTAQLGAISQDPWFSRVQMPQMIDHIAIDLDPPDGLPYRRVLDVARWVRDALASDEGDRICENVRRRRPARLRAAAAQTTYESGLLFAQVIATMVAERHPKEATIERSVKARGRRIYVDYMQNALGKTLAERLQRTRERVCGRVDTADVGRSRRGCVAAGLHGGEFRSAHQVGRRSVGGAEKEARARSSVFVSFVPAEEFVT
jgi:DNA primase